MASFKIALSNILPVGAGYENGWGGEVYKGIPRKHNETWWGWFLIDAHKDSPDFPNNLDSSKDLKNRVERLYKDLYWSPLCGNQIHKQQVADLVFKYATEWGRKRSVRTIQKVVCSQVTGGMDKNTIKKINNMNPSRFLAEFKIKAIENCIKFCEKHPSKWGNFQEWVLDIVKK